LADFRGATHLIATTSCRKTINRPHSSDRDMMLKNWTRSFGIRVLRQRGSALIVRPSPPPNTSVSKKKKAIHNQRPPGRCTRTHRDVAAVSAETNAASRTRFTPDTSWPGGDPVGAKMLIAGEESSSSRLMAHHLARYSRWPKPSNCRLAFRSAAEATGIDGPRGNISARRWLTMAASVSVAGSTMACFKVASISRPTVTPRCRRHENPRSPGTDASPRHLRRVRAEACDDVRQPRFHTPENRQGRMRRKSSGDLRIQALANC